MVSISQRTTALSLTSIILLAALFFSSIAVADAQVTNIPDGTVTADSGYTLADFVGVNVHLSRRKGVFTDTGWSQIESAIGGLGVKYVRTSVNTNTGVERAASLYSTYGIKHTCRIDSRPKTGADEPLDESYIASMVSQCDETGKETILSFNGPNEYNSQAFYQNNANWSEQLQSWVMKLHDEVRSDTGRSDIPIVAPSIWRRITADYQALGDVTSWTDIGNIHNYTGHRLPTYKIDERLSDAQIITPGYPLWVTEFGYNTRYLQKPTGTVTEATQAKYLQRYIGEMFKRNNLVERVFIYQIIDEKPESEDAERGWGLLRNDFSKRPAYYAVQNMLSFLGDTDTSFQPGQLSYQVTSAPATVHGFLIQKSNGKFYLALWNDVLSFDKEARTDIDVAPVPVTLSLNQEVESIRQYSLLPSATTNAPSLVAQFDAPTNITVQVPDYVTVLEIEPAPIGVIADTVPTSGTAPLTTQFTAQGTRGSGTYSYNWNFGDGSSSQEKDPVHTYAAEGSYTASVVVSDGNASAEAVVTVTVLPATPSDTETTTETYELEPTDDVYVTDGSNVEDRSRIKITSDSPEGVGYFRFDLSDIQGVVTSAQLTLRHSKLTSVSGTYNCMWGVHANWDEDSTASAFPNSTSGSGTFPAVLPGRSYVSCDLPLSVETGDAVTVIVHTSDSSDPRFSAHSSETNRPPILTLEVRESTEPGETTPSPQPQPPAPAEEKPTVTLVTSPATIQNGESVTLSWNSIGATSCNSTSIGSTALSGSVQKTPQQTTSYTIACSNGAGTTNASTMVTVVAVTPPPPPSTSDQVRAIERVVIRKYPLVNQRKIAVLEIGDTATVIRDEPLRYHGLTWYHLRLTDGRLGWGVVDYFEYVSQTQPSTTLQEGVYHTLVKVLQRFLNAQGYIVAQTGPGSPGNETNYFGPATTAALVRFRCATDSSCTGQY